MKANRTSGRKAPAAPAREAVVERVDALALLLRQHDLSELEVEEGGVRIYLRAESREPKAESPGATVSARLSTLDSAPVAATLPPAAPSDVETSDGNVLYITSPFVGTFYRSPGPETAPFVDVGTRVRKGQVLCIVEAMKLMNEIESEVEGTVVGILVENGHSVEYGEPLFKIKQG